MTAPRRRPTPHSNLLPGLFLQEASLPQWAETQRLFRHWPPEGARMQQELLQRGGVRSSRLTWGLSRHRGEVGRESSGDPPGSCSPAGTPNSHSSRLLSLCSAPESMADDRPQAKAGLGVGPMPSPGASRSSAKLQSAAYVVPIAARLARPPPFELLAFWVLAVGLCAQW